MLLIVIAIISGALHLALGWEWTLVAGIVAGLLRPRIGWAMGAAGAALSWAAFVIYSAAVEPASFRILVDILGSLAGNIPGESFVGLTVLLGGLLGGLGGGLGTLIRPLLGEGSWGSLLWGSP